MSGYYNTRYVEDSRRAVVWRAIVEYLSQRYVGDASTVLDLGCGYGDFSNNVKASHRIAVDANPDAAAYLAPNVRFIHSSVVDLSGIESDSVDLVFCSNLLEHLVDTELTAMLHEVRRVLRSQGKIVVMQPNYYYAYREYFDDYTHKTVFSHQSLRDFFGAHGFCCAALEARFLPFSMQSRLPKSYWLTKLYLASPVRPQAKQMLGVFVKEEQSDAR